MPPLSHYLPEEGRHVLHWDDLTGTPIHSGVGATAQICQAFKQVLSKYEDSELISYLVLPSPAGLSGFFHCTEAEVHAALLELARQGYGYECEGSMHPVTIWDPLVRRPVPESLAPNCWQLFYEAFMKPKQWIGTGG